MLSKPYCPRCHCVRVVKSGHHHGKQRWLCRRCGYQFTSLSPAAGADDRTKRTAVTLDGHGLSLRCVAKLLATSAHSVIRWVTDYVETFCPKPIPKGAVVIEVDEMWHYLGAKTSCGSGRRSTGPFDRLGVRRSRPGDVRAFAGPPPALERPFAVHRRVRRL